MITQQERQEYLGLTINEITEKKFKARAIIGFVIITLATIVMFTEEANTIYKMGRRVSNTARKASRSGRRVRNLRNHFK